MPYRVRPSCRAAACVLRFSLANRKASALNASSYLRRSSGDTLFDFAAITDEIYVLLLSGLPRLSHLGDGNVLDLGFDLDPGVAGDRFVGNMGTRVLGQCGEEKHKEGGPQEEQFHGISYNNARHEPGVRPAAGLRRPLPAVDYPALLEQGQEPNNPDNHQQLEQEFALEATSIRTLGHEGSAK